MIFFRSILTFLRKSVQGCWNIMNGIMAAAIPCAGQGMRFPIMPELSRWQMCLTPLHPDCPIMIRFPLPVRWIILCPIPGRNLTRIWLRFSQRKSLCIRWAARWPCPTAAGQWCGKIIRNHC